jgi:carbonic anhydrase/acetyltransferase-like protein (isoleucine patch superfamily)
MIRGDAYVPSGPEVRVHPGAYVHPSAQVYGRVEIDEEASLWCNVVVRAEMHRVRIGRRTNLQDFVMVHVGYTAPTVIGENCSITHHSTLHGCTLGDNVLVGIGATVMDGCTIGDNVIVGGHAFLKENTVVPPNSIVMGAPAEVKKTRDNRAANALNAFLYLRNAQAYLAQDHRLWERTDFRAEIEAEMRRLDGLAR